MNPLASFKCAQRFLVSLTAVSSILLMAACGSSNNGPAINQVGFTTSSLSGTYVFSSQGADSGFDPVAIAGTLVADGKGGISGGTMDVVDPVFLPTPPTPAQPITGGSYNVGADGRGNATLNTGAYGTVTLAFVLTSPSHGLVTEFDGNGGGSGTIDLQTGIAGLAGSYAFSVAGYDGSAGVLAAAGAFTLNAGGTITPVGVEDFNDNGNPFTESLTGNATMGSGTGPGSITLTTATFALIYDFYPIDPTHFKLIETDYRQFLAGDVFSQPSTSIPTGTMVFTMSGGINAPISVGGFLNGTTFSGSEDVNNNGTLLTQVGFTGIPGVAGVGGRVVVTLSDFNPTSQLVVYPFNGGILMLEGDDSNVTAGAAYVQLAGASLAPAENYGFNLSAFNTSGGFLENDIAQFLTTSAGFSGAVDINDNDGNGTSLSTQSLSGAYTLDSPSTGRGEATTSAGGSTFVSFIFYAVTNDQFLVLEADNNQIGTGVFGSQNSSGAGPVGQARISLVHPMARSRGAFHHK